MSDQLPVCWLCGQTPDPYGRLVGCVTPGCCVKGALMTPQEWRHLMSRPRLAPEHLERLKQAVAWMRPADHMTGFDDLGDSIRAALEALGEE